MSRRPVQSATVPARPTARRNLLALAVLICLDQRAMRPYEVATALRGRNKHERMGLNLGSIHAVMASLRRRGLIAPRMRFLRAASHDPPCTASPAMARQNPAPGSSTSSALPSTTTCHSVPRCPFSPYLPPDQVVTLLRERARRLERQLAKDHADCLVHKARGIPRVHWLDSEFRTKQVEAELSFVRRLRAEIESESLQGLDDWRVFDQGTYEIQGRTSR